MSVETSLYGGVIAAMITPCSEQGVPDPAMTTRFSRILTENGCNGLFVLGSSGELPLLDEDQRRELTAAAREGAVDGSKIYAGISGFGVKQTIRYARNAAKDGADIAIAMAPFFIKLNQKGLIEYISRIADESPIPVGIYNHFRMPSRFEEKTILEISRHPNIAVIKDTDCEEERTNHLAGSLKSSSLSFFQGRECFLYSSFKAGAAGSVTALANVAPDIHRDLLVAVQTGDHDKAVECRKKVDCLARIFKLDEIRESMAVFGYSIRKIAQLRGWLENTAGMTPGYSGTESYDRKLFDIALEAGILPDAEYNTKKM